ncbi:MAG: TRAP transporter fused permease subunit, partial [Pseudomonadota bacterium]
MPETSKEPVAAAASVPPEDSAVTVFAGTTLQRAFAALCVLYAGWHLYVLNIAPIETWTFRILHVAGTLILGFAMTAALSSNERKGSPGAPRVVASAMALLGAGAAAVAAVALGASLVAEAPPGPAWAVAAFGPALAAATLLGIVAGWIAPGRSGRIAGHDWVLGAVTLIATGFILHSLEAMSLRLRAGTPFADPNNAFAAFALVVLVLELTRRVAGLALVVIAGLFIAYAFAGPSLPGFLEHRGYSTVRFFSYIYTDNGVLGPTTAVSSTYIILFIVFAAFLQSSKVGDYFVDCAFAAAGKQPGGPAKVSVFASGLMGMINGTSAGNVVSTGALTIPLMKRVGYKPQSAGAIEAAASTGGQIMPPIMGAGAFIMAEITGIPYTDLVVAALIPAILYFASIYFMVDFEARRTGLGGVAASELPRAGDLLRRVYLFIPILILVGALFVGYSVIR